MLTVGIDSFVTVEYADNYLASHYLSTDTRLTEWFSLSAQDKEIYLVRGCEALKCLKYRGVLFSAMQPLPFPRYFGEGYSMVYDTLFAPEAEIYPQLKDVPLSVIYAQIEEAFELSCPSVDTEISEDINGAVESYSIGHLSETFRKADSSSVESVLTSRKAQSYIREFVGGDYEIC